jgi:3,4-dihydroxy 2-butanone 4-phosphate synthase/GTP cyclohydrolase II
VFRAVGLADLRSGAEHVALVVGDLTGGRDVPVRVHTECLTGDVFGSRRCACRDRLDASLAAVAAEGRGVVLYLRAGEPAGAGLLRALRGHQLQDAGAEPLDLAPARHAPPPRPGLARQALDALGVRSVRLLGDDPCTARDLTGSGIRVVAARQAPAPPAPVAGALAVAVEVAP